MNCYPSVKSLRHVYGQDLKLGKIFISLTSQISHFFLGIYSDKSLNSFSRWRTFCYHGSSTLIRAKWTFIMCQFLYAYLAFFCIFLWFYVCFSILESFWKVTEERSKNCAKTSKTGKIGKKLKNIKGRELAPRVTNSSFPILAENRLGNWQISFLTSLAINGISKIIPRGLENSEKKERIEGRGVLTVQASTILYFSIIFC